MRLPYALQGIIFAPLFVGLIFVLKSFCPESAGEMCFADFFAVPLFLPLIAVYKVFGYIPGPNGQEVLFLILYWALVGFLIGFILDQYTRQFQYSPEQRPPL
jgi:hypothetical protein